MCADHDQTIGSPAFLTVIPPAPSTSTPRSRTTSNGTGDAENLLRAAGTVAGSTVPLDPEKAEAIAS